jgi:hypothetical protein
MIDSRNDVEHSPELILFFAGFKAIADTASYKVDCRRPYHYLTAIFIFSQIFGGIVGQCCELDFQSDQWRIGVGCRIQHHQINFFPLAGISVP